MMIYMGVASRWLRGLGANDRGEKRAEVGEPGVVARVE
jgi:hypothetical protein